MPQMNTYLMYVQLFNFLFYLLVTTTGSDVNHMIHQAGCRSTVSWSVGQCAIDQKIVDDISAMDGAAEVAYRVGHFVIAAILFSSA